ncbi:hypothetical protein BD779DRAFT_1803065 [Infundibulicybe gibba]|nr:hypothetical protein BD779DRAFT_1803065 [Infundibulicybe gibba]
MFLSTSKLALAFVPLLLLCKVAVAQDEDPWPPSPNEMTFCGPNADCENPILVCCPGLAGASGLHVCVTKSECPSGPPDDH